MIYAGISEQGKRERNEDMLFLPNKGEVSLVIVADGMGGHNAGRTASRIAVETASARVIHGGGLPPETLLREAAQEANQAIYDHAHKVRECRGMGTTMVMALLFRSHYVVANIGDSRLYHYKDDRLFQITKDHSYVAEMVAAGYITPEQALTHPQRNIITSALGAREMEKMDVFDNAWKENDILLLCSDGLYTALESREMARVLKEEQDLQTACSTLVQLASYGSSDNITVVLVKNNEEAC